MTQECYERLQVERESLNARLQRLRLAINGGIGDSLSGRELGLLYAQESAMQAYLDILDKRLYMAVIA